MPDWIRNKDGRKQHTSTISMGIRRQLIAVVVWMMWMVDGRWWMVMVCGGVIVMEVWAVR